VAPGKQASSDQIAGEQYNGEHDDESHNRKRYHDEYLPFSPHSDGIPHRARFRERHRPDDSLDSAGGAGIAEVFVHEQARRRLSNERADTLVDCILIPIFLASDQRLAV
jgi:hypothetical protein